MKKSIIYLSLFSLTILASCKKDDTLDSNTCFCDITLTHKVTGYESEISTAGAVSGSKRQKKKQCKEFEEHVIVDEAFLGDKSKVKEHDQEGGCELR